MEQVETVRNHWECPQIERQRGKCQYSIWDIKTYSGKEKHKLVYETDKEKERVRVIKIGKCYIQITVVEMGLTYSVGYLYSNVAGMFDDRDKTEYFETNVFKKQVHCEDNPFVNCQTPGHSKESILEHRDGDIIHKNELTDIIIDYLLNDKDIFSECSHSENKPLISNSQRTQTIILKFKEIEGFFEINTSWSELDYTITVVDNDTNYSMYFMWDTFNTCHPQWQPCTPSGLEEDNCMTHSIIPKNDLLKC